MGTCLFGVRLFTPLSVPVSSFYHVCWLFSCFVCVFVFFNVNNVCADVHFFFCSFPDPFGDCLNLLLGFYLSSWVRSTFGGHSQTPRHTQAHTSTHTHTFAYRRHMRKNTCTTHTKEHTTKHSTLLSLSLRPRNEPLPRTPHTSDTGDTDEEWHWALALAMLARSMFDCTHSFPLCEWTVWFVFAFVYLNIIVDSWLFRWIHFTTNGKINALLKNCYECSTNEYVTGSWRKI